MRKCGLRRTEIEQYRGSADRVGAMFGITREQVFGERVLCSIRLTKRGSETVVCFGNQRVTSVEALRVYPKFLAQ